MKMSEENKHSWMCRVCLEPREMGSRSIHEKYKEYCIMEYVNKLTAVNIKSADGLPDRICGNCFLELDVALNFIEKCEKADKLLRNHYKSSTLINFTSIKSDFGDLRIKSEENDSEVSGDDNFEYSFIEDQENNEEQNIKREHFIIEQNTSIHEDVHKHTGEQESKEEVKQITSTQEVECHDCGSLFKSKCKLRVHWKATHMLNALICSYCKRKFKTYRALYSHHKRKTKACATARDPNIIIEGEGKTRVFSCKVCGFKTTMIQIFKTHLKIHSGEKPYECDLCPKSFAQLIKLNNHKSYVHKKGVFKFICDHCGKTINNRGDVYHHLLTHRQTTPCPICLKPISKSNLRLHMKRHAGTKTYTCEVCAAAFYTTSELWTHRRNHHMDSDTYKCQLCDYKTNKKWVLKKHQNKHTDQNAACNLCGKFFSTPQKAKVHEKKHSEKHIECLECQKKFMKSWSLKKHMLKIHCIKIDKVEKSFKSKIGMVEIEIPKASPSCSDHTSS